LIYVYVVEMKAVV